MKILNDLFIGWKSGVLGRLKFFLYFLLITAVSLFTTWFATVNPLSLFAFFIFWLGTVLSYYCGILVVVKRYRELVPFPVIMAVIHLAAGILALVKEWEWLSIVCSIVFLLLIAAPGRRVFTVEAIE
ncbi:hypothetical protein [Citrobacter sp. RHB25-C09]|uniref:hypothetical protein n=1 Tax=Citrobacter sp. RHB25-C09 TaxID=2742624 RepID=UPI0015EF2C96|nr:hypothetical protein [Citrobacter sp. RHB25-C09]QMI06789.1 hypothetical protein HVY19_18840 [Citrobacter sp. RHB25-C09]